MQYFSNLIFVLLVIIIAVPATKAICDFFSIEPRVYISYMLWSIALLLFVTLLPSENKSDLMKFAPLVVTAGVAVKKPNIPAVPNVATGATKVAPPVHVPIVDVIRDRNALKQKQEEEKKLEQEALKQAATKAAEQAAKEQARLAALKTEKTRPAEQAAKKLEQEAALKMEQAALAEKKKLEEQVALKTEQEAALKTEKTEQLAAAEQAAKKLEQEAALKLEQAAKKLEQAATKAAEQAAVLKQAAAEQARLAAKEQEAALKQARLEQEAAEQAAALKQARLEANLNRIQNNLGNINDVSESDVHEIDNPALVNSNTQNVDDVIKELVGIFNDQLKQTNRLTNFDWYNDLLGSNSEQIKDLVIKLTADAQNILNGRLGTQWKKNEKTLEIAMGGLVILELLYNIYKKTLPSH